MNPQKYAAIQKEVQEIYQILQKTETELNGNIQARNKYQGQLNENKLVNSELSLLNDDQDQKKVYKLIGPALVQQDLSEAKQTVTKRVKFLEKEIERLDKTMKEQQEAQNKRKERLMNIQKELQQAQMAQYSKMQQQQQQQLQAQAQQAKPQQQ